MYSGGGYDVAQICKNGHLITAYLLTKRELFKKFCPICGEQTINSCGFCKFPIQGINHFHDSTLFDEDFIIPKYCYNCGKAYPWTELQIRAAKKIIDQLDELQLSEREEFKTAIDDIVHETPDAKPAAYKIKTVLAKVRGEAQTMIRDLIVDIASEAIVKIIMPDR